MKKFLPVLCSLIFTDTSLAMTTPKQGDQTKNPQEYVLSHSEFPEDGIVQFDCAKCSSMTNALFIAATKECGNAGCNLFFFKEKQGSYEYVTNVFLNHGGFQFLSREHNGYPDILTYHHLSAEEGTLSKMQFDGKQYVKVGDAKKIKGSEFDKYLKPEPVKQVYFSKDLKKVDR